MVKPTERRAMEEMNGMPLNHRDASKFQGLPLWTKPPTVIPKPSNRPNQYSQATEYPGAGHRHNINPFSGHGVGKNKQQPKNIGNPISSRTMTGSEPFKKRQKLSHTSTNSDYPKSASTSTSRNTAHYDPNCSSATHEIEIINVEDDDSSSASLGIKRTFRERQSSGDEMNIRSGEPLFPQQRSKYTFPANVNRNTHGETSGLIPDGKNTKRLDELFLRASSPIESFEDEREFGRPETRGHVRRLIDKIELMPGHAASPGPGPKIDLSAKIARRMRPQGPSKNAKNQLKAQSTSSLAKDSMQDPIAISTTFSNKARQQMPTPLLKVYNGQVKHTSPKLKAFFGSDELLVIRDEETILFDLSEWPKDSLELAYTVVVDPPMIQIKSSSDAPSTRLLTFQCQSNNSMKLRNDSLIEHLRREIEVSSMVRSGDPLVDLAERHLRPAEQGTSTKSKGPQVEKQRETSNAQAIPVGSIPPEYHRSQTPGLRDDGSEGNALRSTSTSKSRSNPRAIGNTIPARRSTRNAPPEKPVDQDKVILVYPQGIPGAVNITNGDLARLKPGEYLNDTLIEFGLKLWHRQLEEQNPELAQQIHIFNSFFYKKLNNKKNEIQAFETVRKWTSKFDIFQKKYIVVPINEHMHWYLAIIYEPEHVLSTTALEATPARKQTRLSAKVSESVPVPEKAPGDVISATLSVTSSEAEVEQNLNDHFGSQCNIEAPISIANVVSKHQDTVSDGDAGSDLSYLTDPEDASKAPPKQNNHASAEQSKQASVDVDSTDVDNPSEEVGSDRKEKASPSKHELSGLKTIPPSKFYGSASAKSKGKQKAKAGDDIDVEEVQKAQANQTYIFTFDSLGTNHPHAIKKLGQYLRMEAKDKKGISNAGVATGKTALVPVQPNFCDCGVYLLHFAQTFLTDPKKYFSVIMAQSKNVTNPEKQEKWNDKQVADMREELSSQIRAMSAIWMKERALKEEEMRAQGGPKGPDVNVIEDDSDIEMPSPVKKNGRPVARMRG
ncbi:cysteine proteinase [Pholiota conissans]|uniref:Cysteine proteinase n=1 Tax=Pholiota conissans TaxID=109636 RepID=A0A9P5Z454_9AGAR|nr:cysteine proteinase [Pholiota conissans]